MCNLTEKQKAYYDFLVDYLLENWILPTLEKSKTALGYKSKRSIQQFKEVLMDKWYINADSFPIALENIKKPNKLKDFIIEVIKEYESSKASN